MSNRRIAQHFDVAIVGSATGGLVAAALLAKAGLRVLTLAPPQAARPVWQQQADWVSSQAVAVRRVLERLGLLWGRRASGGKQSARQVLLKERRVDVPYGHKATLQALSIEWPSMRGPLHAFFERLSRLNELVERVVSDQSAVLHPTGVQRLTLPFRLRRARRFAAPLDAVTLDALFGGIGRGHALRQVLAAPLAALPVGDGPLPYFAAIRSLSRYWMEDAWPLGEPHEPRASLWQAALAHDGQWWRQQAVDVRIVARRRLGDIGTDIGGQLARAQFILWNTGANERGPRLLDEHSGSGSEHAQAPVADTSAAFCVTGELAHMPVGLADQATFVAADAHPTSSWRLRRPHTRAHDHPLLVAQPSGHSSGQPSAEALRAVLEEFAPYVAESCQIEALPPDGRAPLPPWTAGPTGSGPLGIQSLSMRTPYANVLCTQDDVVPSLGIEGSFWVGWRAAEEVERRLRPKRPAFKRWQPSFAPAL